MHPNKNVLQVRSQYRKHILNCKKKWGTARGLIHYRRLLRAYLWTKGRYVEPWENPNGIQT